MCKKKESPAKLIRLGTYAVETIFIKETAPKTFSLLIAIFCCFFSIITLYTKNLKQIKNTINSAPITVYVVGGKLNVKK